jgi:hypothetical protein
MPFSPIQHKATKTEFKKTEFINLAEGTNVIRILDADYKAVETHYINRMSIKCLGDDCPVCANNRVIIQENPDTFRDIKGYIPRSTRYYINVYDKTPVKICPKCGEEVKHLNLASCPKCRESLISVPVGPLNKVKLLSKGVTLFEQLAALENAILDAQGTPLGLTNFDLILMVKGSGKETVTTPIYTGNPGVKPEVNPEDLYDLEKAVITLTDAEIIDLLKGTDLKDIYTARRLSSDPKSAKINTTPNGVLPQSLEDAANDVLKLFNND